MLRTEVTLGGCCWAVEPIIRRSLFYGVNDKILCLCGQRGHPQVFYWAGGPPFRVSTLRLALPSCGCPALAIFARAGSAFPKFPKWGLPHPSRAFCGRVGLPRGLQSA